MNILFLADPNSIHDVKWINYFTSRGLLRAFLLPRKGHWSVFNSGSSELKVSVLSPIRDFSIVRFYQTLITALRIRRIIKQEKIDLINIHYAEPNSLWCVFRWYFKVPMIITTLGTDVLFTIPQAFRRDTLINHLVAPAYRFAFRKADWITSTSQAQLDSIIKFSGRTEQLSIVRTGVELGRLMLDTSAHFPLKDDQRFVLFPRYIKPIYNHEFSLAAIALLGPHTKKKFKMVFVGKDNGDLEYQRKLESMMFQQPDVKFEFIAKQSQEAIFELYKRAALVVMVPKSDGSPVSGMEALACGAQLILAPLHYDPDIFSQAIKLRKWDAAELAEQIMDALAWPTGLFELREELKRTIDIHHNMQKMLKIYRTLGDESLKAKTSH